MKKERVFANLAKQPAEALLEYLDAKAPRSRVDGKDLLDEIELFKRQSLAGDFYHCVNVNSKNWMDVPEETDEWFERLAEFLRDSSQLTKQGDHADAVACFAVLFHLIERMEHGDEIVFADELGSWMIPCDQKTCIADYLVSAAANATPEQFAVAAIPLIDRDSGHSFADKAYESSLRAADKAQKAHLLAEIERRQIRTPEQQSPRKAARRR